MERSVADYDAEQGRYERPEQGWVCGRAAEGRPCAIGPDRRGTCRVHLECVPLLRDDRWHCTRPDAAGGRCQDGPLPDGRCPHQPPPCQPRRSLLARRRVVCFVTAAAALGLLFALSGQETGKGFLSPGGLSAHHQGLEMRCTECHGVEQGHFALTTLGTDNALEQSRRCVECHRFGPHALQPHALDPQQLAAATRRIEEADYAAHPPGWLALARMGPGIPRGAEGQLACALCHREHRGRNHDLRQISESRCQICHAKPFDRFSEDHPEFVAYPHQRRMRIHFDHGNHYARHFALFRRIMPDGRKPDSCTTCHVADPSGARMLVRGFEQSCAACHGPEIESEDVLPGLTFVRLPALDESARKWMGTGWPRYFEHGAGVLDSGPLEQLPPFMLLLLDGDARFRRAVRTLSTVNLGRLDSATPEQKQAVKDYLAAIRRLLNDLVEGRGGNANKALLSRLKRAVRRPPDRAALQALAGPRSSGAHLVDAIEQASHTWFPRSQAKNPSPRETPDEKKPPAASGPKNGVRRFGGWTWHPEQFEIRYRPGRHADPFLKAWIDLCCDNLSAESVSAAARKAGSPPATPREALARQFRNLADPAAAGVCLKCHTVDRQPDGTLQVNWTGFRPQPYRHRATHFSHGPHLEELGTAGCTQCHVLDRQIHLLRKEFVGSDLRPRFEADARLTSGFHGMQRQECATCHRAESAGESCLQCHNYHVGRFPPRK